VNVIRVLCHGLIQIIWHSETHRALLTDLVLVDSGFPHVGSGRYPGAR
jgi:hypothetical protein